MSSKDFPKRGEVYWVDLDPTVGAETQKTRPGLIVSNNIGNEVSKVVMIAPITSKLKQSSYPFEVKSSINGKPAKIMLNQCRAVDKSRLKQKIGEVDPETMLAVVEALKIVFSIS